MLVVFGKSQIVLVHADGILVLEKDVQVSVLEFFWNLEVASLGDVVSSEFHPGSAGDIAFNRSADVSHSLIHEGVYLVLLDLNDADEVIPFDGDFVGSAVLDDDLAILVTVDADQRGYPGQCWCSWAVDRGYVCLVWVCFPVEFGRYDAGGHSRNDHLFGGADRVHFGVGKLDLSHVHVACCGA